MLSTQFNRDNQYQAITKPSLLAGCIALALLPSAAFAAPATEETVIVEGSATAPDDGENDYSVTSTSAGTKMQMTQRDIPQSVTIVSQQRMEDQQLQTLGEVMENTLGISKSQADSDRALYYSRGFQIDNYMVDGIPTYFESRWNLGDALSDMALFERVEVVRGATGLMTGTGNPSAAINMVRKHATSREFKGDVSAEYGSWNKERYVADLQSPLTEDGKIRARIVGGYQNNDSWLDRYNSEKTFFSGIVDADLGDLTTLSAGYEYQRIDVNSPTWGGLPRWNTDGSSNSYDRARSTAPDWAYNDKEINKVFMTLKQRFADTWQATLNATHSEVEFDSKMMYVDAYVNKADGMLVGPYSNYGPGFEFGATRYIAEDNEGNAVNPNLPRTTVKMFTSYRLPVMPELTVGGGVNWQNRVYTNTVTPYGTFRAEQGSYALVDLFTRYQVTKNFSLQGNVNNLFDKTYDTNVEGSIVYGTPRNFSITSTYQF